MSIEKIDDIVMKVKPILDSVSDAVCIMDSMDNIIYSNSFYEKMIKRGSTELVSDAKDIYIGEKRIGKTVVYHDISEVNRLRRELDRLNQKLRKVQTKYSFDDIIGSTSELKNVIKTAKIAAMTPATIMIRGESGTGKEIFAHAIHNASPRRNEKFVKINCSSLPEELLESELFGYKEGAFTGARRGGKSGLFQEADKGTLFLDEIGDVSSRMQVKLLRALQEKEIMPVGSTKIIPIDVRIICATNKHLEELIRNGQFREDLYYRLNVFPLFVPPLRERLDDIGEISRYLINQYSEFYGRKVRDITDDAVEELKNREWAGNVRELENVLSRALINLEKEEEILGKSDILVALGKESNKIKEDEKEDNDFYLPSNLKEASRLIEERCIKNALLKCGGDKNKAAYELGIPLRTLYYKCKKLNL